MAIADDDPPEAEPTPAQRGGRPARQAPLAWYEADPRGVIRIDPPAYRIPRRLAQTVRAAPFAVTSDHSFGRVIRACADPRREGGWISEELIAIFEVLHEAGLAHSIEAWLPLEEPSNRPSASPDAAGAGAFDLDSHLVDADNSRVLVGGLYGLCVGGVFCAESMFSRPDLGGRDASKVCLVRTIEHLRDRGFALLDTQMWSEHLAQFGCERVSRETYHELLRSLRDTPCHWGAFPSEPRA